VKTPSRSWGACFVIGAVPGAIFVSVGGASVELPLDNLTSLAGLEAALRDIGEKTWMRDEVVGQLRRAIYDVLGVIVHMRLTSSPGGSSLVVERFEDGGSGITDRIMRPDVLRKLRDSWRSWQQGSRHEQDRQGARTRMDIGSVPSDLCSGSARR
jgi:hypothetical protein